MGFYQPTSTTIKLQWLGGFFVEKNHDFRAPSSTRIEAIQWSEPKAPAGGWKTSMYWGTFWDAASNDSWHFITISI